MFESDKMSPFIIASFDIEADSSHGDFPLAKKNYKKLSTDVLDNYVKLKEKIKNSKNLSKDFIQSLKDKIKDPVEYISDTIKLGFIDKENNENINYVYTKGNLKPNFKNINKISKKVLNIVEKPESYKQLGIDIISNFQFDILDTDKVDDIEEILEDYELISKLIDDAFVEDDNIEFKDFVNVSKVFSKTNKKPTKSMINRSSKIVMKIYIKLFKQILEHTQDIKNTHKILLNYETLLDDTFDLKEIDLPDDLKMDNILKLIELSLTQMLSKLTEILPELDTSRDVKIKKITLLYDRYFPSVEGDKVIQIGTVVQKYGETEPYLKHMITLDTCDPIEG